MEDQILDNMDIERERGITIKARAVTMNYTAKDGKAYELRTSSTPRAMWTSPTRSAAALAACEGAVLRGGRHPGRGGPDPRQHLYGAGPRRPRAGAHPEQDRPCPRPIRTSRRRRWRTSSACPASTLPRVSAKTGPNIDQVLERVVASDIPAPTGDPDAPLKALIFDSIYDSYKGVIVYIRVFEGTVKPARSHPPPGHRRPVHAGGGGPHRCRRPDPLQPSCRPARSAT